MFSLVQNPQLSSSFKNVHCGHTHNFSTRSASKHILDIPYSPAYTYGTKSVMHSCIKDWNNFKRSFPKLFQDQLTYSRIKSILTNTYVTNIKPQKIVSVYPFISSIQTQGQFAIESLKVNTSVMISVLIYL